MDKKIYEIDGANFSTLDGFYDEMSRVVIPEAKWGHNLDAFHDILRGGFGTPEGGFILRWTNSDLSRIRLGHAQTAEQLRKRLERCHPMNRHVVLGKLSDAEQSKGPTVFDWLVEIIRDHGPGGREPDSGVELELSQGC